MNYPDLINGIFETFGGLLLLFSVYKAYKDKKIMGVSVIPVAFFASWGMWNLWFYPSQELMFSFYGGILLVAVNIVWIVQIFYYMYFYKSEDDIKVEVTTPTPVKKTKSKMITAPKKTRKKSRKKRAKKKPNSMAHKLMHKIYKTGNKHPNVIPNTSTQLYLETKDKLASIQAETGAKRATMISHLLTLFAIKYKEGDNAVLPSLSEFRKFDSNFGDLEREKCASSYGRSKIADEVIKEFKIKINKNQNYVVNFMLVEMLENYNHPDMKILDALK